MLGENTALSAAYETAGRGRPAVLGGRFVLQERLDIGRFGAMYKAFDRQRGASVQPYVIVLVVPREISRDSSRREMFERALERVRSLSHPNIVAVHEVIGDGDALLLVLDWVDGESLRNVIDSLLPETICERDALDVVRAVGAALSCVHQAGLAHGDVLPENVLVTPRGDVKLLVASACLTASGPLSVAPRDDVRALAGMAFEMLRGEPPPLPGFYGGAKEDAPRRIRGLSRRRWNALKGALGPRDGRFNHVRQLLKALDLPGNDARAGKPLRIRSSRSRLRIAGAAALLLGGLVALAAGMSRVWPDRASAVPHVSAWASSASDRLGAAAEGMRRAADAALARLETAREAIATRGAETAPDDARAESDLDAATAGEPVAAGAAGLDRAADSAGAAGSEAAADSAGAAGSEAAADSAGTAGSEAAADSADVADFAESEQGAAEQPIGPSAVRAERAAQSAERVAQSAETGAGGDAAASAERGAAATVVEFVRNEYVVSEGDGVAVIGISRGSADGELAIVAWTREGRATAGDDYADLGRIVERFADGEVSKELYIPLISDSIPEDVKSFEVHVGALSEQGNQRGALESARVVIIDDD